MTLTILGWAIYRDALDDPHVEALLGEAWPDLWRYRRRWFPKLEQRFPIVKFEIPLHDSEWGGITDASPEEVRAALNARDDAYPVNLAGVKSWDGRREVGSYAVRKNGLFGTWQTHIRLSPGPGDRAVYSAHHELSPIGGLADGLIAALRAGWRHYHGEGWDAKEGVRRAHEVFVEEGLVE
ncbi:hypothetical protein ACFQJC_04935 [Haloferax namakaokahaiae]|uniref:Polyketide cyclase / dehydrase and lipid transport n=1 Tax=Haloferax namakaokahaiae TaxID=1748331 RepID=A0ABD5ZCH1_9EURY